MRFTQIPADAFEALQVDAGVLAWDFDPSAPEKFDKKDIICATTGGINASCGPTTMDYAEDVDNAPNNLLEFKRLTGWDCKISTTGLGTSPELIRLALGAADVSGDKITPRRDLELDDFKDIWFIGDKADGGFVAVKLMNALSTGGFSLQTSKDGKGQTSIELTGHVSIKAQDVVPMEFYSTIGEAAGGEAKEPEGEPETNSTTSESEVNEDETF